jgi:hypothetical protein
VNVLHGETIIAYTHGEMILTPGVVTLSKAESVEQHLLATIRLGVIAFLA